MAKSSRRSASGKSKSRFYQAVQATRSIASAYQKGLKALREPDKHRIACANSRQLRGSVCIDDALKAALPNEPRWDYAVGYSDTAGAEQIIWVEVHPAAKSDHLKEVRGKLEWLMEWLRTKAQPMNYTPRRIVWIATGLSNFSQGDPHIRALKDRGLEFVGRRLEL